MSKKDLSDWTSAMHVKVADQPHACFCVGPQNADPVCPCAMRNRRNDENAAWLKGYEAAIEAMKKNP